MFHVLCTPHVHSVVESACYCVHHIRCSACQVLFDGDSSTVKGGSDVVCFLPMRTGVTSLPAAEEARLLSRAVLPEPLRDRRFVNVPKVRTSSLSSDEHVPWKDGFVSGVSV